MSTSPAMNNNIPLLDIKKDAKWDLKHIFEEELKLKDKEILGLKRQLRDQRTEINMLRKRIDSNNHIETTRTKTPMAIKNCRMCIENKRLVSEKESLIKDLVLRLQKTETSKDSVKTYKSPEERRASSSSGESDFSLSNLDKIISKIIELNRLALENGSDISRQSRRASFKKKEAVHIDFYSNGFRLGRGNSRIRSYDESSSIRFLSDISDGFFPSELQGEYPKGVTFLVNDRRTEEGVNEVGNGDFIPFSGGGRRLGTHKSPKREQRLPHIRRKTPKLERKTLRHNSLKSENSKRATKRKCMIKILHPNVNSVFTLQDDDTIEGLKCLIREVISERDFHLYSSYPRLRVDQWNSQTLSELGFFPNYVLHVVSASRDDRPQE